MMMTTDSGLTTYLTSVLAQMSGDIVPIHVLIPTHIKKHTSIPFLALITSSQSLGQGL